MIIKQSNTCWAIIQLYEPWKGKVKTWGGYKPGSIRTVLLSGDEQRESPLWAPLWKQMTHSQPNQFLSAVRLESLLNDLPSVDRMSLWNRPWDFFREVENKATNIFEKFEFSNWFDVHVLFLTSAHCFSVFHNTLSFVAGRKWCLIVMVTNLVCVMFLAQNCQLWC